jgi:hypothetical protein
MRLYVDGRLQTTQAGDADLKNALARLKDGMARDLELMDTERKLTIKRQDGAYFMDVVDDNRMRYGMLVDAPRAMKALSVFLKGELPMPSPVLPIGGPGVRSVVIGDAFRDDCPLCKMLGHAS